MKIRNEEGLTAKAAEYMQDKRRVMKLDEEDIESLIDYFHREQIVDGIMLGIETKFNLNENEL